MRNAKVALAEKINDLSLDFDKVYVVIGASSGIAKATIQALTINKQHLVIAISRKFHKHQNECREEENNVIKVTCDYSSNSINRIIGQLCTANLIIDVIYLFNGMLHNESIKPEKQLQQFNVQNFQQVLSVNTLVPMQWLQSLYKLLRKDSDTYIVILSARVGSIEDNRLGGWYSYRASKAALNMLIKTAAIEYKRHARQVRLIAFHPGTTDTDLSKPFQKNVPKGKLFTPEFVGQQLGNIKQKWKSDKNIGFIDWQYKEIKW
jgi:NAD(P)-dependent dehydrogenase (short-subunit alcohol dehydrogenase family)